VAKHEGSRSQKAVAFIFDKGNISSVSVNTETYFNLRISQQAAINFLEQLFPAKRSNYSLIKNIGDKKWIK